MTVTKPIIFFSHSSRDKKALKILKDRFVELTGGTIDVFLSSDGQSMRLGKNWVATIETALRDAKIMFVFVSPNSISSPWLYFETGHAYSKQIDVVPVGLFGVDIGQLSPPLNLLQGFNISDADSLNNIIQKANEVFEFKHRLAFANADYDAFSSDASILAARRILGAHVAAMTDCDLTVKLTAPQITQFVDTVRTLHGFAQHGSEAVAAGVKLSWNRPNQKDTLLAEVDPGAVANVLPTLDVALAATADPPSGSPPYLRLVFDSSVKHEEAAHRQLARLGTAVSLPDTSQRLNYLWLRWNDVDFVVGKAVLGAERKQVAAVSFVTRAATFTGSKIGELVDLLFDSEVLWYAR